MLSGLKERAEQIKKTRVAAEMVIYENKVNEFLNFDVEKELRINRELLKEDIAKARKVWSIGSVIVLGAASIVMGPVALPVMATAFLAMTFVSGDTEPLENLKLALSNVDKVNKKEIKQKLASMEYSLQHTVNTKTTKSDYFKGIKDAIKEAYQTAVENRTTNKAVHNQYNKSINNILAKRDEMRLKINDMTPAGTSLKI